MVVVDVKLKVFVVVLKAVVVVAVEMVIAEHWRMFWWW